ncbi:alanine--tRNA ligase-related protein [Deinococcus maricopensis]|uniref:Alanyl-tRNA synthetase, class IIc n=1 Tax=Deinococcus maricopensis (strain DSM 21211 / LMG 22137 / NRRL B-23946 / LB-34) TaxID=709986 RepID=E8UB06_DEIML|nr:alanyl-tRNA editing protein [Deinococcus maricopensis]ADV68245.1 Alanyl-tRNA synthetase, class IIc [Deinococcus maricopensis DSM 21211]
MTTELWFRDDPTRLTFDARVMEVRDGAVALDGTCFYPEGGGQNADAGTLAWAGGEVRVVDVQREAGVVWHRVDGPAPAVGEAVMGRVEAGRRWRHMERHSGEHLLAQAFVRIHPRLRVAAVSMRSAECTLDLEGDPTEAEVRAAEALLREVIRRDLRLETVTVPESELGSYPLRRPPQVRGDVRLVMFRDEAGELFDVSACGGTHVPRAAVVAPVVVLRTERVRGGLTRVVFMAGEEAQAYLGGVYRDARALAGTFSTGVEGLSERVEALRAERDALSAELKQARTQLAAALTLQVTPESLNGAPVRFVALPDARLLPDVLEATPAQEVVVAFAPDGRVGVGSARADVQAGQALKVALGASGGRGGGRPDRAQGQTPDVDAFLRAARTHLGGEA